MKTPASACNFWFLFRIAASVALLAPAGLRAAESFSVTNGLPAVPKSTFIVPTSEKEGRDPFYPNSIRTPGTGPVQKEGAQASAQPIPLMLSGLNLKPGNRMAIINRRSIAEGETVEIEVAGGILKVHCLEITRSNSVIIEVGGQKQELRMRVE